MSIIRSKRRFSSGFTRHDYGRAAERRVDPAVRFGAVAASFVVAVMIGFVFDRRISSYNQPLSDPRASLSGQPIEPGDAKPSSHNPFPGWGQREGQQLEFDPYFFSESIDGKYKLSQLSLKVVSQEPGDFVELILGGDSRGAYIAQLDRGQLNGYYAVQGVDRVALERTPAAIAESGAVLLEAKRVDDTRIDLFMNGTKAISLVGASIGSGPIGVSSSLWGRGIEELRIEGTLTGK